jgi:signal transduction histidine kinase
MQLRPVYHDMRTVTEPGRSLLTRIHVALAMEQSLLRDYLENPDSITVVRYRKAVEEEHRAYAELEPLISQLGPAVRTEFEQLRELERGWHGEIAKFLERARTQRLSRDPLHAKLYEDVLLSAARLDEALNAAAARRWTAIEATNRAQEWITFVVGFIALAAAVLVAWLGRRLRTYAVTEEAARHELEEAIESRERLMRGITHDLRNPLQTISGHAEILEEGIRGPLTPLQGESVAGIRSSARHLLSMIGDLLELARAEGGRLEIRPGETLIGPIVVETVREYSSRAAKTGLHLTTTVASDLPAVITDGDRVKQVLENLVSNAIKYTPSGGTVRVCAETRRPQGARPRSVWIAIDVSDTGEGIPRDRLETIFDEFTRLESHIGKPGAGLGLAIARRVARLLGGDVTVSSSSSGSTFTLWLPQDRRTVASAPAPDPVPPAVGTR